jgi:hypothetical protein
MPIILGRLGISVAERAPDAGLSEFASDSDRCFVLAAGGYSLELAGGSLVTHERIPVPKFNHALVRRLGPGRQSAFFERALDHYFQRAIRPTFRVEGPVPEHIDRTLGQLAFRRRPNPYRLLWARPHSNARAAEGIAVREAGTGELDTIVGFWTDGPNREELRRSLDVVWNRPNSGERLVPLLAERDGVPVGSAVVLEQPPVASLHGVATVPDDRDHGIASSLVAFALGAPDPAIVGAVVFGTDASSAGPRLEPLGFSALRELVEYELPPDAALAMPDPGPAQPPRWRPPRTPAGSAGPAPRPGPQ